MRENSYGFLLIEVLAALALGSVVAAGLLAFYSWGNMALKHHENETNVRYGIRRALEYLEKDIRGCGSLQVYGPDNDPVEADAPGSRLELEHYSGPGSERVLYYVNPNNHTLYRDNVTLNNKLAVAMDIEDIAFSRSQPGLLHIELTASSGGVRYDLRTDVYPRVESRVGSL